MKLIVAVTGATGTILAKRLLEEMKNRKIEIHLIISKNAKKSMSYENILPDQLTSLANNIYEEDQLDASIASGSFKTDGMIIIPCSMKTLGGIASGYSENLILRAADVTLKENRKLILVPRESPLSYIHLRNMTIAKRAGAIIIPPMLSFYNKPRTLEDAIDFVIGRVLDSLGIEHEIYNRWK